MQNILVTGSAGFIGGYASYALLKNKQRVVGIDNYNDYYSPAKKMRRTDHLFRANYPSSTPFVFRELDIRDAMLADLFKEVKPDVVVHLAALAGVRASVNEPFEYYDVNLNGTLNILECMRATGTKKLVFASTSSVYGNTKTLPFVETDTADRPLAPYPASKRAAELAIHAYHHLYGIDAYCLRLFNVYGPDGRPDMMPVKVLDCLTNDQTFTLYNGGEVWRDWTYIDDIVNGIVSAVNTANGYECINLGYGAPSSMNNFVTILEGLTGKTARYHSEPLPASDPLSTHCNNSKARELLGFAPEVDLAEGLKRTWARYPQY